MALITQSSPSHEKMECPKLDKKSCSRGLDPVVVDFCRSSANKISFSLAVRVRLFAFADFDNKEVVSCVVLRFCFAAEDCREGFVRVALSRARPG